MTVKEFKQSYKSFLTNITKHTPNTANKYLSYINKACHLPGMSDLWDRLASSDVPAQKIKYVEELCDIIVASLSDPNCSIKEKDLRDCQSSAHVLLAFVSGQTWIKNKGVDLQFVAVYNKKALRSKFLSRLTTQDRIYPFGAFPIYIIHSIATGKKISLFDKMISKIKFIYDDKGNFVYFNDIERVMIATNGHAYFEKNGTIYPIFTQIPKKNPAEYCIAFAPEISNLSLDHDVPLENKLKVAIKSMPTFETLSKDILIFKQAYKQNHKGADTREICRAYKDNMLKLDEDLLLKEVEKFLADLSLTIMQKNFNSAKSNRS